jgi:hypothetical protein
MMAGPYRLQRSTRLPPDVLLRNLAGGSIFDPPALYSTRELVNPL